MARTLYDVAWGHGCIWKPSGDQGSIPEMATSFHVAGEDLWVQSCASSALAIRKWRCCKHSSGVVCAGAAYPGLTKVGWTVNLPNRLGRHANCCQADFICLHSFPEVAGQLVPRARQCEGQIHAALKSKGLWPGKLPCTASTVEHQEWYRGTVQQIREVVKKHVREFRVLYGEVLTSAY